MFSLKNIEMNFRELRRRAASIIPKNTRSSRNLALDFLTCNAVLALCTLNGLLFRHLGFSDAIIISVYILGVLISAVLVTNYIANFIVSFEAMIVFNFFFTEPLYTLHAYDAEYPVTFIAMLIVSLIAGTIALRLKAIAKQSDLMYARTKLLSDTASQLHKLSDYKEILDTTGGQLTKLTNEPVYLYERSRGSEICLIYSPGEAVPREVPTDKRSLAAVKWVFQKNEQAGSGTAGPRGVKELLDYAAENIRRRMIIVAVTDQAGVSAIDESLLRKVTVNNDLLVISLDDAWLTGGNVYDVDNERYESELLFGGEGLAEAERRAREAVYAGAEKRFNSYRVSMLKLAREDEIIPVIIDLFERHRN